MYNPALSCYIQSTTIIIIIIIIQWMLKACIIIIECSEAGSMFHNRKLAKANDLLSRWVLVYSTTHDYIQMQLMPHTSWHLSSRYGSARLCSVLLIYGLSWLYVSFSSVQFSDF